MTKNDKRIIVPKDLEEFRKAGIEMTGMAILPGASEFINSSEMEQLQALFHGELEVFFDHKEPNKLRITFPPQVNATYLQTKLRKLGISATLVEVAPRLHKEISRKEFNCVFTGERKK